MQNAPFFRGILLAATRVIAALLEMDSVRYRVRVDTVAVQQQIGLLCFINLQDN
jgi:hypothetical protein